MNMSLEQVRDALKGVWVPTHWGTDGRSYEMSDLIESLDHYLSQPQPVAQGEAAAVVLLSITSGDPVMQVMEGWDRLPKGNYLLHVQPTLPPGLRARLMGLIAEAWVHGKDEAQLGAMADELIANLHATPTTPTGHRVVPVEPEDLSNCTDGFGINKTVNAMLADALRFLAKPGQKVIWRGSFRWFDDDGVLSNHYDGMDIDHLARDFDYEVHYDAHHAALVSKKAAPDAGGV